MNSSLKKFWFWGWIVLQTYQKAKTNSPNAMTDVWENLLIVNADDECEAYERLTEIGKSEEGDCRGSLLLWGKPAVTRFVGVSDFGVIHEEFVDGAEILWRSKKMQKAKARSLIKPKRKALAETKRELSFKRA